MDTHKCEMVKVELRHKRPKHVISSEGNFLVKMMKMQSQQGIKSDLKGTSPNVLPLIMTAGFDRGLEDVLTLAVAVSSSSSLQQHKHTVSITGNSPSR